MGKSFAVIDTGCQGITAIAASWTKDYGYTLDAFYHSKSRGLNRGMVTDIGLATDCISNVVAELKKRSKKNIHEVYAGITSPSVSTTRSSGTILLSRYGKEVSETDIEKCVKIASTIKTSIDKEPLHRIVQDFSLDGEKGIKNPLNLEGVKLEAQLSVLTINSSVLQNMSKCIANAGFIPAGFIFSGIASARRVLNEEDMYKGVLLLNLRRGLTEAMVFYRGALYDCRVYPSGTEDILSGEKILVQDALVELSDSIMRTGGWERVRKVVIIGEGSLESELIEKLEDLFAVPVKPGVCTAKSYEKLPAERAGYITSLGILDHLQEKRKKHHFESNILRKSRNKVLGFIEKYF